MSLISDKLQKSYQMIKLENDKELKPREERFYLLVFIVLVIVLLALGISQCQAQTRSNAQIDTVLCHNECIQDIIVTQTDPIKVFAIYKDERHGISDLIPISKSVYTYIQTCEKYHIEPQLGIRLRNGQITGLIRFKPKYVVR